MKPHCERMLVGDLEIDGRGGALICSEPSAQRTLLCASCWSCRVREWISAPSSPPFPCFLFLPFHPWDYIHSTEEKAREVDKAITTSLKTSVLAPEPIFYTKGWWGDVHLNSDNSTARLEVEADASDLKVLGPRMEPQMQKAWLLHSCPLPPHHISSNPESPTSPPTFLTPTPYFRCVSTRVNRWPLLCEDKTGLSDAAGSQVRWCPVCLWHDPVHWRSQEEQLTPPTRLALLLHMLLFRWCRCSRERTLVANVPYKWEGVAAFNRMEWTAYLWGEQQGLSRCCYQSIPASYICIESIQEVPEAGCNGLDFSIASLENGKIRKQNHQRGGCLGTTSSHESTI